MKPDKGQGEIPDLYINIVDPYLLKSEVIGCCGRDEKRMTTQNRHKFKISISILRGGYKFS